MRHSCTLRSALVSLAAVGAFHVPALAQEEKPQSLSVFVGAVKQQFVNACAANRSAVDAAKTELERGKAHMGVVFNCDCMPTALDELAAKKELAAAKVTSDEALALLKPALERCGGIVMRDQVLTQCGREGNEEKGVRDQAAYCSCVRAEVGKHSDAEVVAEAIAMYKEFEARVQARREKKPDPPKYDGLFKQIDDSCRAAQGAPHD